MAEVHEATPHDSAPSPAPERPAANAWRNAWRIVRAVGPALLVATIVAARNPDALFRAEFWAEDATEFFFGAMALGVKSLAVPVYGYHFLVSRAVAYAATFAPVFYTPFVYAWASLVINVVTVAYVTRERFSWIAPRRWQRILLAITLALGPGTSDAFLNLANLPNVLALLGLLLLIERPFVLDRKRTLALVVLVLSSGQMVLWLPLVVYMAWVKRSRTHTVLAIVIAAVAALNVIGSRQASSEAQLLADDGLGVIARIVVENAFTRLIPGPFLGSGVTSMLMASSSAVFWSAALAGFLGIGALVIHGYRRQPTETASLVLAYAGAVGGLGVVALSRNYAVPQLVRESGDFLWDNRYALLPGAVAIIFWASWLLRAGTSGLASNVATAFAACAIATNVVVHWGAVWPRPDLHWPQRAERVQWVLDERARTGKGVIIGIQHLAVHPVGWLPNNGRTRVVLPPR